MSSVGSTSEFFGTIFIGDDPAVIDPTTYHLRLHPDGTTPTVGFRPVGATTEFSVNTTFSGGVTTMTFTNGTVNSLVLLDSVTNGTTMRIPALGTNLLSTTATRVLLSDATGNIGALTSVPVNLGGTGLTAVPAANTLLGSNGTGFIPVTAGANITISGGVISAVEPTNAEFQTLTLERASPASDTPTIINVPANKDYYSIPVTYTSSVSATPVMVSIAMPTNTAYTVRILATRKSSISNLAGGSTQQFNVYRVLNLPVPNSFGSTSSTVSNPASVTLTPNVTNLDLSRSLNAGDIWKALIEFVQI